MAAIRAFGRAVPFSNGGWVQHGVQIGDQRSRYSVWFDPDGQLVDAERIDARNRAHPVRSAKTLATLRRVGLLVDAPN